MFNTEKPFSSLKKFYESDKETFDHLFGTLGIVYTAVGIAGLLITETSPNHANVLEWTVSMIVTCGGITASINHFVPPTINTLAKVITETRKKYRTSH